MVLATGSTLMDLPGVGPVVAARVLADVGDVARFADRNRFASWTGTAPIEASSGEIVRHRLSRAGNRRMNHMIHIAAATQIRLDTPGRAYYRRKLTEGKTRMEAMRCLKRRISDAIYRQLLADAQAAAAAGAEHGPGRALRGVFKNPARPALTRTPALRISHFPDPHPRRYRPPRPVRTPARARLPSQRADAPEPSRWSAPPDERPNGQMSGPSLRTTSALQPLVKIARPAQSGRMPCALFRRRPLDEDRHAPAGGAGPLLELRDRGSTRRASPGSTRCGPRAGRGAGDPSRPRDQTLFAFDRSLRTPHRTGAPRVAEVTNGQSDGGPSSPSIRERA